MINRNVHKEKEDKCYLKVSNPMRKKEESKTEKNIYNV